MKKHTRNTRGPGAWVLGGVASLMMCVSALGQYVATQSTPISIPDHGNGNPYPSQIDLTKSNILGVIEKVSVTVNNLTHPSAPDLGFLLVGPNNQAVVLLGNSGGNPSGSAALNGVTLIFSDDASGNAPQGSPLVSGTSYKPTDNTGGTGLSFGAPAPSSGYDLTLASAFKNLNPNGVWSLYVLDTTPGPPTTLTPALGSWSLNFNTTPTLAVQTNSSTTTNIVFGGNALTTFVNQDNSVTVNLVVNSSSVDPGTLTVTATGIPTLATNFTYGGSGQNRTVTISPNANTYGTNTLTLKVADKIGSVSTNITLAVAHVDQVPLISLSTNAVTTVAVQMTTNVIIATLGSLDPAFHPTNALNVVALSSDSTIVSPTSVFMAPLDPSGGRRAVTVVPTGTGTGTATVTLRVDNGVKTNSASFTVTVLPIVPPTFANTQLTETDGQSAFGITNTSITIPANTLAGLIGNVKVSISGLTLPQANNNAANTITLTGPNGASIPLLVDQTATSRSYGQIVFADGALGSLPPNNDLTNTIALAPASPLSSLLGVNPNGTWTLSLVNPNSPPLIMLNGWTLTITVGPTVGAVSPNPVLGPEESTQTATFTIGSIDSTITNVTGFFPTGVTPFAKFTGSFSGNTGTLTIQGLFNSPGTNIVQAVATDKNNYKGTNTFLLGLSFVDHPPVISFIPRQVVPAGEVLTNVGFTVTDVDTPLSQVTVRASSDNQKLVPDGNIVVVQTGGPASGIYTMTVFPIGAVSGSANITVTANDHDTSGTGVTTSSVVFNVFVQAPNFPLFPYTGGITINNSAPGSPYAATNVVSGLIGAVESVRVTLVNVNDPTPGNVKVLLVGPNNSTNVLLLAGAGGNLPIAGTTLAFDDNAASTLTSAQIVSGIFQPSGNGLNNVSFQAPAPPANYGVNLFDFANTPANGNWLLYVTDTGSSQKGSIAGGWQLSIHTAPSIPAIKDQFTTVNQSTNIPITVGDNQPGANLTVTAAVTGGPDADVLFPITNITVSGSTAFLQINPLPYTSGTNIITVTVSDGVNSTQNTFKMGVAFAAQPPLFTLVPANTNVPAATQLGPLPFKIFSPQGTTLTVTASSLDNPGLVPSVQVTSGSSLNNTNSYTLSLIPAGVQTGTATITIQATDGTLKSSASFVVTVTPNLAFANTGLITIPQGPTTPGQLQQGVSTPYPSAITVKGLGGVVSSVQATLVGLNHGHPEDLDILLVAPDNTTAVMLMAHAGSGGPASELRVNFSDTAAGPAPQFSPLTTTSYQVSDYSGGLTLPAPAATRPYKTSLSGFAGVNPNGNWQLYVLDDTFPTGGTIDNGWVLYLQTAPAIAAIGPQTTPENTALAVPLSISDATTDPTNLTVTVASAGDFPPDLVDPTNLVLSGSGASRTLTITPSLNLPSAYNALNNYSNAPGTNLITVTVKDPINNLTTAAKFPFTVTFVNQPPTITTATNAVYVDENTSGTINFTIGDVDSIVTNITATSSNQGLLANSNIVVTIPGGKITPGTTATVGVKVTPTLNVFGALSLTVVATDGALFTTNVVTLNINHIWQQPTITGPVSPQPVIAGSSTTNIDFTVGSVEVPSKSLLVYATSDNTSLVPNSPANIIIGGSGNNRTIQLFTIAYSATPVSAHITIVVTDLSGNVNSTNSSASFTLNATPVNNVFANTAALKTTGAGPANIYPSTIPVAGLVGGVFKADVVLPDFSHSNPANLDILLVEESTDLKTNATILMSGAGGTNSVGSIRLQFDDAGTVLPTTGPLSSATYAPANYTKGLILPPPAPTNALWSANLTSAFSGLNPNGNWKLFVNDRGSGDSGDIATGWQLIIQTDPTIAFANGTPANLPITENSFNTVTINLQDMFVDPTNMNVTASSDTQSLIPDRNVTFSKITSSGFNGSVYGGSLVATITPATLQSGTAKVTFKVTRSDGAVATVTLPVTVNAVNVPATISRLDPISMPENTSTNVTFIISDPDSTMASLNVVATSDTGALIPNTGLIFQGLTPATNRLFGIPANNGPQSSLLTLTLTPAAFQIGSATISITVTDATPASAGVNIVSNGFVLTVTAVVYPPFFISAPKDQSVAAGGTLAGVAFAVASPVAAASTITNVATSSDQSLIKDANIHITQDASGTNRLISITAESNTKGGTAVVTLVVGDPALSSGGTATTKFNVTVRPTRIITLSNSGIINIIDNAPASPYPSQIVVSNLLGPISKVTATLNGFTHSFASDVGVLLVSPTGQKIVLMNNLATGRPGPTNVNLTFDQTAASAIPINVPLNNGTYLPLDNSGGRIFAGTSTPYTNTLNAFTGISPNGTWSLYVEDFVLGDFGAISNGWSLGITTLPVINGLADITTNENASAVESFTVADDNTNNTSFTFTATSDNANVVTNNGIVITGSGTNYTVTVNPVPNAFGSANITVSMVNGDGQTVNQKFKATFTQVFYPPTINPITSQSTFAGTGATVPLVYGNIGYNQAQLTVTFQSSNPNLVPAGNMKLSGSNLLISPVGVQSGSALITVIVTNPNNQSTNTSFTLTVQPNSTPVFAQTQTITINDNAAATPYPSTLTVAGLAGTVSKVTATMIGFGHSFPSDVSILLVGPQGQAVVLMSRAGGSVGITNTRLTFDDSAASVLPQFSFIADGTYMPTDYKASDTFFPVVPPAPYSHALSAFNGSNPNGTWSLFVQDDQSQNSGVITGGWVLSITTSGPSISQPGPQTTPENTPLTVFFAVNSSSINPSNLIVTATNTLDSPTGLVSGLTLGGFGRARTLLITPAANMPSIVTTNNGTNLITMTVTDGTLTNSVSFPLTVTYSNQPPTISGLTNQSTPANVPLSVSFTVSDVDDPVSNLVVAATTSVPGLGTATVTGTNGVEVLTYKPKGVVGTNTVSVTASDGVSTTTNTITVISLPGLPPVVGSIAPQTVPNTRSGTTAKVNFTVNSGPLGATNLTVVATADNTNLVPSVIVTGAGSNFTATVTVAPLLLGTANITIFARDEFGIGTNLFTLTVRQPVAPALATIANVSTPVNTTSNITLQVTSLDTSLANLLFTATDTNSALLKPSFTITGTNEVLLLNVVSNMTGFDFVTVHVSDGYTNIAQSFSVTVTPIGAISMTAIGTQNTAANTPARVSLPITSPSTSVTNLTLTGTSTNKALVSSITFTYNGRNMVAVVNLVPNTGGRDFVTITATDGFSTAVQSFLLIVSGGSVTPTLTISISAGQLNLTATGSANAVYTLQSSPDLKTWTTVTTITANAAGVATYTTPVTSANKDLFYRTKQ